MDMVFAASALQNWRLSLRRLPSIPERVKRLKQRCWFYGKPVSRRFYREWRIMEHL